MSKFEIMHVVPTFADCSITRIVLSIIQHLGMDEYHWTVISTNNDGPMDQLYETYGVTTGLIPGPNHFNRSCQLHSILASRSVDLIHTHTPKTTLLTWLANLNSKKVKYLYTKHSFGSNYRNFEWIYQLVEIISLYQTDHLIPVSKTMAERLLKYPGIHSGWVSLIQNGIDTIAFYQPDEREACRKEFNLTPENLVIFFAGRLEQVKGVHLLLNSFATIHKNHPHLRLLIAGTGSLQNELQMQALQLGIDKYIIWCGWRTDIARLLAASDVFVQSSLNEGLPLNVIEAMAAGKAIVATNVGGINEILEHNKSGIVVQPNNVGVLTDALSSLIETPEVRYQLAKQAQSVAKQHFDIVRVMKQYETVYRNLLGHR